LYTISKNLEHTTIVQKSIFHTHFFLLETEKDIPVFLEQLKEQYPDATHHCYAYIYHEKRKCFDDGEPSGTAGIPILNVLEKKKLCNVLCIVTRYFGGIKLGAGGLVRAYTKATTDCLSIGTILPYIEYETISISFSYDHQKYISALLKDCIILKKEYQETIVYQVKIEKEKVPHLMEQLKPYIDNSSI